MNYDIKPLGVGGILDQAVNLIKTRFWLFFGIAACIAIPAGLALNFLSLAMLPAVPPNPTPEDMLVFQQEMASKILPLGLISMLVSIFVYPLTTGAMIHAVSSEYLGNETSVGASIGAAFKKFFPLLWTSILMFLTVYVGIIMCIIPGLYFLIRNTLSSHAVMLEDYSGRSALQRSSELMLHDRSKNYNTLVLLWILLGVVGFATGFVGGLIPQPHIKIVVTVLLQAILQTFGAAAFAIFYFSCRCKADNFDLELLAESIGSDVDSPSPDDQPFADDFR